MSVDLEEILRACAACGEEKPSTAFYRDRARASGLRPYCKTCDADQTARWLGQNRERYREYQARWRRLNEERIRNASKRYHNSPKGRLRGRADHLMRRYGLTVEDYDRMEAEQNKVCAVCDQPETVIDPRTGEVRRLAVDHNHTTGEVRALLCAACNTALGRVGDCPDRLRLLAAYLEAFS